MHFCSMANQKSDARALAREYYLTTNKTQDEIAQLVGVNRKTMSVWVNEEKWEMQKAAYNVTPRKTIAGYLLQLEKMREHIEARKGGEDGNPWANSKESDIITKITKAIKVLQRDLTLTDYIQAFEDLTKYGMNIDHEATTQFVKIMNDFIQNKAKELTKS